MSFPYVADVLNAQADEDAARIVSVALYTGAPGSSGTSNEATGGSPTYARQSPNFSPGGDEGPLGGTQPATDGVAWGEATFDLPAGTYTHYGAFGTGSVWLGGTALPANIVMSAQGTHQVSIAAGPVV